MCGILGMIGNVQNCYRDSAFEILKLIFILSSSRGDHATGFSAIHNRPSARLIHEKRPISSKLFCQRSIKFNTLKRDMPSIFIGHTRFATSGAPNRGRNNHPFNSNRYSLVHNGIIPKWNDVASSAGVILRSETDSEVLLRLIEKREKVEDGIQYMIAKCYSSSKIAIALMEYGTQNKKLHLFRNLDNRIYVLGIPGFRTIFFASEEKILDEAIGEYWGRGLETAKELYGISITLLPSWKLSKFTFDNVGLPHHDGLIVMDDTGTIDPASHYNWGNHSSSSGAYQIVQSRSLDSKEKSTATTPSISEQYPQITRVNVVNKLDTESSINNLREPIKSMTVDLSLRLEKSLSILKSIRENDFMTQEEVEDFKRWMTKV